MSGGKYGARIFKRKKTLSRTPKHYKALMRNMFCCLVEHERIRTTVRKARELKVHADKVITWAKRKDEIGRRRVVAFTYTKNVADKVLKVFPKRYENRIGGYTRVLKAGFRKGDCAPMCYIEFLDGPKSSPNASERQTKLTKGLLGVLDDDMMNIKKEKTV